VVYVKSHPDSLHGTVDEYVRNANFPTLSRLIRKRTDRKGMAYLENATFYSALDRKEKRDAAFITKYLKTMPFC
jgi:hypothetical protein